MKLNKTLILFGFSIILVIILCHQFGKKMIEGFANARVCPNIIEQRNGKIYLYNSNVVSVPGVNPVIFNNLEEYKEYIQYKRSLGYKCPILFFKTKYDTQNKLSYQLVPDPTNPSIYVPLKSIPDGRDILKGNYDIDTPAPQHRNAKNMDSTMTPFDSNDFFNRNIPGPSGINNSDGYLGYDPNDQDIGTRNTVDDKFNDNNRINAMNDEWVGEKDAKLAFPKDKK